MRKELSLSKKAMSLIKRYHPSAGDIALLKLGNIRMLKGKSPEHIAEFDHYLADVELTHTLLLKSTINQTVSGMIERDMAKTLIWGVCDLVNIVGIILPKHNRRRLNKIKSRLLQRQDQTKVLN